jgi:hypothetical protein
MAIATTALIMAMDTVGHIIHAQEFPLASEQAGMDMVDIEEATMDPALE